MDSLIQETLSKEVILYILSFGNSLPLWGIGALFKRLCRQKNKDVLSLEQGINIILPCIEQDFFACYLGTYPYYHDATPIQKSDCHKYIKNPIYWHIPEEKEKNRTFLILESTFKGKVAVGASIPPWSRGAVCHKLLEDSLSRHRVSGSNKNTHTTDTPPILLDTPIKSHQRLIELILWTTLRQDCLPSELKEEIDAYFPQEKNTEASIISLLQYGVQKNFLRCYIGTYQEYGEFTSLQHPKDFELLLHPSYWHPYRVPHKRCCTIEITLQGRVHINPYHRFEAYQQWLHKHGYEEIAQERAARKKKPKR